MDKLSISEKRRWLSDMISREVKRFENDTKTKIDNLSISRIDGNVTSVNVNIYREFDL